MLQNGKLNTDIQNPYVINHKYKDCLLRIAFREKKDLLELYNAINGSDYNDPEDLIVYTLEDVVFMGIKNDISFLVGEMLNLYEHQSTKNPNMPVRGLLYFARNYQSYIARNGLDIHSSTLQKLPFPQYYVLYNGGEDEEDRCTMELEDAFPDIKGVEPCLRCTATLLNINYGHNREIMKRSKTLSDYAVYVQRIRESQGLGMNLQEAVDNATDQCIAEGILKDILLKNRAEVKNMVLGTWGTELHLRKEKEEREKRDREIQELEKREAKLRLATNELERETVELKQETTELKQKTVELKQETIELKQKATELKKKTTAINLLTQKLIDEGLLNELKMASADEEYQMELLEKYHLI